MVKYRCIAPKSGDVIHRAHVKREEILMELYKCEDLERYEVLIRDLHDVDDILRSAKDIMSIGLRKNI